MNLYLLTYTNDDGFNMDLVVQGESPKQAFLDWKKYWRECESLGNQEFSGDVEEISELQPPQYDHSVLKIFQILPGNSPGVLDWCFHRTNVLRSTGSCNLIGYANP